MDTDGSALFDPAVIARNRLRRWIAIAVAAVIALALGAELLPALRRPDLALLDFWQSIRAAKRPSPQIAIVGVDEKSIARLGPPAWPRNAYVPLIERLSAAGAKVIAFDFTFGALDREAENNKLLADAMKKAGNVVFGYEFTRVGDPSPPAEPAPAPVRATALSRSEGVAVPPAPSMIAPEPVLASAAAAVGHVRAVVGEDGRMRALPLVIEHGDQGYPSLALQAARIYSGTPAKDVALDGSTVKVGALDVPVSASGEVYLNWPQGGEKAFPIYSFLDVVRGDVPDDAFRGKAVLVAGTADGLDDRDFAFAAEAPGVLAYAIFLDNLFRYDFVRTPGWGWPLEWALLLALAALAVLLMPRLPTPMLLAGVPVLALLLLGAAGFLLVQKGLWVKPFYPALALVAPLALLLGVRLTASEQETRDLSVQKTENEKLLGLSFQEKGMLDMAMATFAKLPLTEDMKVVYLNLGLDYENRGHRDKAFLAYKRLFDVDPKFEDVGERMERIRQQGFSGSMFATPTMAGRTAAGFRIPGGTQAPRTAATGLPPAPGGEATPPPHFPDIPEGMPTQMHGAAEGAATQIHGAPEGTPTKIHDAPAEGTPTQVHASADGGATQVHGTATGGPARGPSTPIAPPRVSAPGHAGVASTGIVPPPMAAGPAPPGARLGRYEVERHLGRGGMGDVYLVRDMVIHRRAALKTMRLDANLDPKQAIEIRQRFYREGQTAGKLTHPSIVTIYDVGEDEGMSYIVMEFVEGETLTHWMEKQRLNVAQIKHVVYNTAVALEYAHENGVFHRDVKPDNIMVGKNGAVKVMDFGIARVVESNLTRVGSVMGTPAYMSPEQAAGQRVDARSDVFSLGVILYELLVGRRPFQGETMAALMAAILKDDPLPPSQADPNVSSAWDAIVLKALAKKPGERYASARELAEAVRGAPNT